ncbi:hypothetical protein BEP19_00160 [Ammoniphilus oxalaticus]|uniref:Voltage-dependent anion channel n=1 Tax=Ammoniphilus oxalaticus TaxID=66863 RepID=A0A419SR51_9BACL|nr:hypothetical protein [Ammoniphilus oxalaticus]RKD27026.1 hypothetical protein BEP19_00160 [Ammoniphilus oxalaticus]
MLIKGSFKRIEPTAAAIIMANGIFLIGAIEAFPFLNDRLGKILAFLLLISWIVIYIRLSVQFFHHQFLIPFLKNPIHSFAMGTWIAGVSVLCNVFLKYYPSMIIVTQAMALINTLLWVFFLTMCFYNFKQILFNDQKYPVHGILLLSTVGTQSIIVLLNNVFFQLPMMVSSLIITLGFLFYLIGASLIVNRYALKRGWTLVDDWANTNCILHGALSITGLAIVSSNTFTSAFVAVLWVVIFILLVIVETIEIFRAVLRVKRYGWNKGLFNYHITQWSRNFTFGMFYAFTLFVHKNPSYVIPVPLQAFQVQFLSFWSVIVLLTLLGQIGVYLKYRLEKRALWAKMSRSISG